MEIAGWSALVGTLLIVMALAGTVLARIPLSTSMLYLAVGVALSPVWLGMADFDLTRHAPAIELLTEVVVVVSLFSAGLKLSAGLDNRRWIPPLRLALTSMLVTVAAVTTIGVFLLGLPVGAAILLAGILAPTDPVLASDVQVASPDDRDQLRFALTGEGGLNDGAAFPIVMLGLGLLGLHEIGPLASRWLLIDVLWAAIAGLFIGATLGALVGKLVIYLRRTHGEAVGLDNFLALGLIGLTYGAAILLHAYGFLAVFAAGVALRFMERRTSRAAGLAVSAQTGVAEAGVAPRAGGAAVTAAAPTAAELESAATDPIHAPAFLAHAMLSYSEQLDRIGEVAAVVVIGALLWAIDFSLAPWWFVALLLLLVRPMAVLIGLAGSRISTPQQRLIAWFGIRGVGSLYYLSYAINRGVSGELANTLTALTLTVVVTSIVVHGISVTPLMRYYERAG